MKKAAVESAASDRGSPHRPRSARRHPASLYPLHLWRVPQRSRRRRLRRLWPNL